MPSQLSSFDRFTLQPSRLILLCAVFLFSASGLCEDRVVPPRIFYTDLLSGPDTGGESGMGAFVTLYGVGFGASRGLSSVTVDGTTAYAYSSWSDAKIVFQIAKGTRSGSIAVHTALQPDSNGKPFLIRAGRILFVSTAGNDEQSGTFLKPWKTLLAAKERCRAGDIVYLMNGVEQSSLEDYDSSLSIQTGGSADKPIALVAYPGARVIIGSFTGPKIAARTPNIEQTSDHWVLAGLTFRGAQQALDITASSDWRIIGNDFSCPYGTGASGCVETSQATHIAFLGNTVHDVAKPGTTKVYHAVYFSTDSNHIDVGWNTISNVRGCRAIQFHSSRLEPNTGFNQFDLHVHDNIIHDVACDGINFATVDPSRGPVEAYNNLIYNAGTGPDPEDGSANYACIYVQGGANAGPPGTGTVEVYNNTLYHCGARHNSNSGALSLSGGSPKQQVRLRNNLVVLSPGVPFLSPGSNPAALEGEANLIWSPSGQTGTSPRLKLRLLSTDPLLIDPDHGDFMISRSSPAVNAGIAIDLTWDLRGAPRTIKGGLDLGALHHATAGDRSF